MQQLTRMNRALFSSVLILSLVAGPLPALAEPQLAMIEPSTLESTGVDQAQTVHDLLQVTAQPMELSAKLLQQKYQGVYIRVTNPTSQPITLTSAVLENGVSGAEAYEAAHKSLLGWTSFLGVSGLVISTIRRTSRNSKARNESEQYTNEPIAGVLQPGQTIEIRRLLPVEHPVVTVNVSYQDPESGKDVTQQHLF